MTNLHAGPAASGTDRFDAIEALLSRYPSISEAELADLQHWFRKEASAFEVASLASKDELRSEYRAFRAEHFDKFTGRDILSGVLFAFALLAGVFLVMLPGL